MYPSHITAEIGRMRAEEMRGRADRYRLARMARRHPEDPRPNEKPLARFRVYVARKALAIVGLGNTGRAATEGAGGRRPR